MTLVLTQSATAVAPFIGASFLLSGGVDPPMYEVLPGGAGGEIDPTTGLYTAPGYVQEDPKLVYDTIQATDYSGDTATSRILVGTPLMLLCEILQRELDLPDGYVYLWDQKINQPKDSRLYVAVSQLTTKVIGNNLGSVPTSGGMEQQQYIACKGSITLDVISRSSAALMRKEEVLMALASQYSRQQQDANSFSVATVPTAFANLSQVDGAAIPYRFQLTVGMFYSQPRVKPAEYFDQFDEPELTVDDGGDE